MQKSKNIYLWLSVALLLLISFLSISELHPGSLYYDETISVSHVGNPYNYNDVIAVARSIQIKSPQHAPGYFWLLSFWVRLTGYPQFALRAFSMLMGLAGAAMIYRLAKDMAGKKAGVLALALISTSMLYIFYLHEIRMYTQVVLVATLQLWFYYRVVVAPGRVKTWLWSGLGLSTLAALYTHYLSIFPIFGLCLYHLLFVRKDRRWWAVVFTLGIAGAVFAPWLSVVFRGSSGVISPIIKGSALHLTWLFLILFGNGTIVTGSVVIASLIAAIFYKNRGLWMVAFIFLASWGAFAIANQISLLMPDYRTRYLLLFWPPAVPVVAIVGAHFVRQRWILFGFTALWLVAGLWLRGTDDFSFYNNRTAFNQSQYPPYPALIKAFYRNGLPGSQDLVLLSTRGDEPFAMPEANLYYSLRLQTRIDYVFPNFWREMLDYDALNTSPVIWWAYAPDDIYQSQREAITEVLLETHQACNFVEQNSEIVLINYVRRPFSCDWLEESHAVARFEEYTIEIYGVEMMFYDNQVVIGTKWMVPQTVPLYQYSVAIKLYDADGAFLKQSDFELPSGYNARHVTLMNAEDLIDGNYTVVVSVYDWQTLEHLTGIQLDSGASGRETFIGQFNIKRE